LFSRSWSSRSLGSGRPKRSCLTRV